VPPIVSTLRLVALMIFIALVAVAVWLADLRLAVALPLVAFAWLIAAAIEYLAWRSARGNVAVVETGVPAAVAVPPPVPVQQAEPEPEPVMEAPPVEQTIVQPAPPEPEPEAEPEIVEPEPEPAPPAPEPEAEPEPEPPKAEPTPELEPEPPVLDEAPPALVPEEPVSEAQSRWARRKRLRAVPTPPPEPAPAGPPLAAATPQADSQVVPLPQRSYAPRQWNIWDLERLARAEAPEHPEQRDEWAFLFVHLRQFANADGVLPTEFDSLVRESFGGLLERQPSR
jgi:hypothetical protein